VKHLREVLFSVGSSQMPRYTVAAAKKCVFSSVRPEAISREPTGQASQSTDNLERAELEE
jgi:hypothetical protein